MNFTPVSADIASSTGSLFPGLSELSRLARQDTSVSAQGDAVNIAGRTPLTDEEAETTLAQVIQDIPGMPGEALSMHSGLDYSRVMDLLAPIV